MAQHDFINKGPKSKKPTQNKKPLPKLMVLIALVLVASFGYGLWFIKQNADPEKVQAVKETKQSRSKQQEINPDDLPKEPDFIKKIKEHEVQVEIKEQKKRGPYQMQCGSFRNHKDAESMKAQMAFAGLFAEIRRTEGKNGVWYRVRLGPYDTKRAAESDKNKLKRINIVSCGIWGWT